MRDRYRFLGDIVVLLPIIGDSPTRSAVAALADAIPETDEWF